MLAPLLRTRLPAASAGTGEVSGFGVRATCSLASCAPGFPRRLPFGARASIACR